ncbi:hypothetical protein BDY17DRAFT_294794 [Neohortaea acidophila]|uniref:Uncharacterized protein n=1 Tax=Neohortaea acidophila TaxID=245834 RepID=A0A6A6PW70_9PEZI|nr:uncharacterized protein BDY17DRAFT_294794 [Neohortaea acidophila]KAF2484016.1 hypothetical protein BDY17DRAFT_294794 [Neohortaea acidophila]
MDVPGFALITGAGSGMGRECAKTFARDGAAGVALLDINAAALEATKAEVEPLSMRKDFKILTHILDVSDEVQVNHVVQDTAQQFGRLDYVVNCAGIGHKHIGGAAFAETQDWQRVLDINLNGTFFVLRAATRIMLKQSPIKSTIDGRDLQRGSIVNFASVAGLTGIPMSTAYCASKHAVIGLTRTASEDYARQGIKINAVCPGYMRTPFTMGNPEIAKSLEERINFMTPLGRLGEPGEVADAVVYLSGGRSSYVVGSAMIVDGGYTER